MYSAWQARQAAGSACARSGGSSWARRLPRSTGSTTRFNDFIDRLAALPRSRDPQSCPRVVVTGDFFTRFSPFFMEGVRDLYAAHGIILKPVDLNDHLLNGVYNGVADTASTWGLKPGNLAMAKACTRIFQPDGKEYLQRWLTFQTERRAEGRYRELFQRSGLLVADANEVSTLFGKAAEHVSPSICNEVIPTVGKALVAGAEGYDGVIVIGPFNCLPFRISEAIEAAQPSARHAPAQLRERRLCGLAVRPAAGGCTRAASPRPRGGGRREGVSG